MNTVWTQQFFDSYEHFKSDLDPILFNSHPDPELRIATSDPYPPPWNLTRKNNKTLYFKTTTLNQPKTNRKILNLLTIQFSGNQCTDLYLDVFLDPEKS